MKLWLKNIPVCFNYIFSCIIILIIIKLLADNDYKTFNNKNVEMLRNQFVNGLLKEVKSRKSCIHCKTPINPMKILKNKIILTTPKLEQSHDANTSSLASKLKVMESKYVTPEESKRYMRQIWAEEEEFLGHILSVLNGVKCEHPTDVFFFEVIPVPPTNVRPVCFYY